MTADVWSVTSWTELRRDGLAAEEHNFRHPEAERRVPHITRELAATPGPVIVTTDFVSEVPDQIRQFIPRPFATLGADGHGFSDTRPAARRWFRIDVHSVVVRALQMLADEGQLDRAAALEAAQRYQLIAVTRGTTGNAGGDS